MSTTDTFQTVGQLDEDAPTEVTIVWDAVEDAGEVHIGGLIAGDIRRTSVNRWQGTRNDGSVAIAGAADGVIAAERVARDALRGHRGYCPRSHPDDDSRCTCGGR